MLIAWIIAGLLYFGSAVLATLLARIIDDPYGHVGNGRAWTQAIVFGVFWPLWLIYTIGSVVYYSLTERDS